MDSTISLDAVLAEAKAALKSGDAQRACKLLSENRELGWNDAKFLEILGVACCMSGHPEDALEPLERALDITPSPMAHFNLGNAYEMLGNLDEAKSCFTHAISLDPTYHHAVEALENLVGKEDHHDVAGAHPVEYAGDPHVHDGATLLTSAAPAISWEDLMKPDAPDEPSASVESPSAPPPPPMSEPQIGFTPASSRPDMDGAKPHIPRPKTAEEIAMEAYEKEEAAQNEWKKFLKSGLIYGAIVGAVLAGVLYGFEFLNSGIHALGPKTMVGLIALVVFRLSVGAIFGAMIGFWVAYQRGAATEGAIAGFTITALLTFCSMLISGNSITVAVFSGVIQGLFGGLAGAFIGYATGASIDPN